MPLKVRDGGEAPFYDANVEVEDVGEYESDVEEEDVREYVDVEDVRLEEQEEEYEGGNGDAEYVEQDIEGNGEKVEDGEEEEDIEYRETDFEQTDEEDDNVFHSYVVIEEVGDKKELGEVETDEYDTEDFESLSEGKEVEEEGRKRGLKAPKFKQYNKEHDLLDPKFHIGMKFPTIHDCRQAIRYYSIAYGKKIKYLKNEPYMVRLVCDDAPKGNEESIKDLTTTTKRQG
ncbi:hypothetical protein L3X38_013186 [Prunus dulcis]|uniref:Transposase MuDR plant domain-containing protein n=1 Tax=Prunus dulcis TaxID=3755 RepID=A0AAD4ZGS8_PRUDU|nr:hypothetical protein L3X38_013186 [Prunus dulcis]